MVVGTALGVVVGPLESIWNLMDSSGGVVELCPPKTQLSGNVVDTQESLWEAKLKLRFP